MSHRSGRAILAKNLFPDFPDMKVDFAVIGIGKIGSPQSASFRTIAANNHTQLVLLLQLFALCFACNKFSNST